MSMLEQAQKLAESQVKEIDKETEESSGEGVETVLDAKHSSSLIEVKQLSYKAGSSQLLKQVNCSFESGQIHIIIGQNGAGKSTLLNCLSHELKPSKGSIDWRGQPLSSLSYADLALERAVLSQSSELAFSFTVQELIELGEEVKPRSRVLSDSVIETVLNVCDLQHLRARDYLTLSGGEQKRVQLARVLAQIWPDHVTQAFPPPAQNMQDPKTSLPFQGLWLFLDEWTAGLDIKHQQRLGRYFKQWAKQGLGIVMVLHDISFAAQLADRCLLLQAGQVFADGDVFETLTEENLHMAMEIAVRVETDPQTSRPLICPII